MEIERVRARAHGRVQGVGFRFAAARRAAELGLAGWVRNDDDGSVETVAEGPPAVLDAFVAWLHRGPRGAHVTRVEAAREAARGESGFRIVQ